MADEIVDANEHEQISALETEIKKVTSVQGEIAKAINEVDALSHNVRSVLAQMVELKKDLNDISETIDDTSMKSKIHEVEKRIRDIEELV